jgi:dTMP kinase
MAFLSLDGVDGAGKSTQLGLLVSWLEEQGRDVVLCRDPGSTRLGETIRDILLHQKETPLHPRSEMLLYMAARSQLVEDVIRPALSRGQDVVSDRYLLANVVYQAHAGGLDVEMTWRVGEVATDGLMPDLTLVLDLPVEAAARRRTGEPDRLESRGDDYLQKVRDGFLREAEMNDAVSVIDANREVAEIQSDIRRLTQRVLDLPPG